MFYGGMNLFGSMVRSDKVTLDIIADHGQLSGQKNVTQGETGYL